MKNQLFLNCTLYSEEIGIALYTENPLFKENYIQDNPIIYEDAAYSGRIVIDEPEEQISSIIVQLNGNEIGNVEFSSENKKIVGDIRFCIQNEDISQPFLLQCDMIEVCFKILYADNSFSWLYSPYLLCVSKNQDDTENTESMLRELLQYDNDRINKWIFQKNNGSKKQEGILEGSMRSKAYKSISSYLQLAEQIVNCYRNCLPYFKNTPKHSVSKIYEMKKYSELRKFTQKDLGWLSQNLEQLALCDEPTGIEYEGDYYLPLNVMSERKKLNYDIYENRIIISFLKYLVLDIYKLMEELEKTVINEEQIYRKLRRISLKGYHAPIITVKKIQSQYVRTVLERTKQVLQVLEQIYRMYRDCLPCTVITFSGKPRRTKIFQEIKPYRIIYDMLIKWFEFGEISLEKEKTIFRVKTMDKLFEYYCLQQLLRMLAEQEFSIDNLKFFEYKVEDSIYDNEMEVANTYIFKRKDWNVILYYQPVVFSEDYQNGLGVYRTTMTSRSKYYTPDFIMEFSNGNEKHYVIFDSKYSNRKNILKYHMKECIMKYGVETEAEGDNADVRMVWVLQGRVDGEKSFEYYHNSPNAKIARNAKSYGIVSINSKINNRQRLWQEIINNVCR